MLKTIAMGFFLLFALAVVIALLAGLFFGVIKGDKPRGGFDQW